MLCIFSSIYKWGPNLFNLRATKFNSRGSEAVIIEDRTHPPR